MVAILCRAIRSLQHRFQLVSPIWPDDAGNLITLPQGSGPYFCSRTNVNDEVPDQMPDLVTVTACSTIIGLATSTDETTAPSTTSSAAATDTALSSLSPNSPPAPAISTSAPQLSPATTSTPASTIPTQTAAEELLNRYTAQELLDCDLTTLNRQMDGSAYSGEQLSDCEIAYSIATASTLGLLTSSEDATLLKHAANLEEMSVEINRLGPITNAVELRVLCNTVPAWSESVQDASEYYESLDELDLLGWRVSILNAQRYLTGMLETCNDI